MSLKNNGVMPTVQLPGLAVALSGFRLEALIQTEMLTLSPGPMFGPMPLKGIRMVLTKPS